MTEKGSSGLEQDTASARHSFLKGTMILALAAFIARFFGLIQRVPLQHLLGDAGMATYGIAYNIYSALLVVATAGVPSALSKLISDRTALGRHREALDIYRAAIRFAIWTGVIMTVFLFVVAPYYAEYVTKDPDATLAIRSLAPAMLMFPLIAIMRGYFQGRQIMIAQGISQIVEQILRVTTAIAFAAILVWTGYSSDIAAAGASFGGVTGAIGALVIMIWFWLRSRKQDRHLYIKEQFYYRRSNREIYRQLFRIAIPISIVSLNIPMIYFIDSSITIGLLEGQIGYEAAKETLGILTGRAQAFAGIAPVLAIAIGQTILPVVSSAYAQRDMERVKSQSALALKVTILTALPVVLVLCAAAPAFNSFLFGDSEGSGIIALLVASTMLQVVMMATGSILTGLDQTRLTMRIVLLGIVVKFVASILLAQVLGIYGIVGATVLGFVFILTFYFLVLRRIITFKVFPLRQWVILAVSALVLGAVGFGMQELLSSLLTTPASRLDDAVIAGIVSILLLMSYIVVVLKCQLVSDEDLTYVPDRLQRWLVKLLRFIPKRLR